MKSILWTLATLPLLSATTVSAAETADPSGGENAPPSRLTQEHLLGPEPGPDLALPGPANPHRHDENAIKEGRRLFVWFNCSGCHGGRAGGGMGPSLRDAAWIYGNKGYDIFNSISEGRPHGMPAWGPKLPADQIWKLTAYIQALDTEKEIDPPPENPVYPDPPPRRDVRGVKAGGGDDGADDQNEGGQD